MTGATAKGVGQIFAIGHGDAGRRCNGPRCRVINRLGSDEIAKETGKSVPQIGLNWLLRRPTVTSVIIGARNEEQLKENLGADGWALSPEQVARLDTVSAQRPSYPFWHQVRFPDLTPLPVGS